MVQQIPAAAESKPEVIELVQISAKDLPVPTEEATHSVSGGGSAAIDETLVACEDGELLHTDVKFDTGAFFLNDGSRAALSNVVELMRADPELQVEVQGHTDNVGTAKRNLSLSERRAEAVAQYLTHATGNIDNAPIAVGYGADMPLADNGDAAGRAQNRRIDVLFSGGQSCGQSLAQADVDFLEADTTNEWALPSQQLAQLGTQTSAVGEQCVAVQSVVENLNFEPAGYRLGARAKNALSDVIEVLREDPSLMVEVYGYSADYGDAEFDHALAERRAETVADYLMVKSGNFENIPVAVGFGDLGQGVVANPDDGLYRANRIELRLSKGVACEQPLTNEISIRRPLQRAEADIAPSTAALLQSQGGGGTPDVVEPFVQSCQSEVRVLEGVSFSAGHFELDGSSKRALTQVAEALGAYPELQYSVHGHTDASGNPHANHALSEWRARVVAEYLARETGSWPVVADAEGFGETRPLASNDSAAGRAVNRRIELAITDPSC